MIICGYQINPYIKCALTGVAVIPPVPASVSSAFLLCFLSKFVERLKRFSRWNHNVRCLVDESKTQMTHINLRFWTKSIPCGDNV